MTAFHLTFDQLLSDLQSALESACIHKKGNPHVQAYLKIAETDLPQLCEELYSRSYKPRPSSCFVITEPKKREIFAADFRDRIVHHLYFNYTHELFERTFIQDSYSCIRHRGTHYGIHRLEQHIRKESQNYSVQCYVMKLDIRGYFIHINRQILYSRCIEILRRLTSRMPGPIDLDFVEYLTHVIALQDPTENCIMKGDSHLWDDLPKDKSLFHTDPGCGLPIGNLTSQLFSNVYLGLFDDFMKRTLHCRHYGRYVDDAYIVSSDKQWLQSLLPQIRTFLKEQLGLTLHEGKLRIYDVRQGVEFIGAFLKPGRKYVSNPCLRRMRMKIDVLNRQADSLMVEGEKVSASLNSFLGIMGHYSSYRIRSELMRQKHDFTLYGQFSLDCRKFISGAV